MSHNAYERTIEGGLLMILLTLFGAISLTLVAGVLATRWSLRDYILHDEDMRRWVLALMVTVVSGFLFGLTFAMQYMGAR